MNNLVCQNWIGWMGYPFAVQFSPREEDVLYLRRTYGLSFPEIAEKLGIRRQACKAFYLRAERKERRFWQSQRDTRAPAPERAVA
jgi:DNA-directed RNA polymerase specialized sigma24 family protein